MLKIQFQTSYGENKTLLWSSLPVEFLQTLHVLEELLLLIDYKSKLLNLSLLVC